MLASYLIKSPLASSIAVAVISVANPELALWFDGRVLSVFSAIGQEQCCPICCSEYIKDDIATELPCHHFFHKPCVSIWLQKVSFRTLP